jgi:hypothetical protein
MVFLAASSQSLDLSLSPLVTESGLKHLTHYHNINTLTLVHCKGKKILFLSLSFFSAHDFQNIFLKVTLEGINDAALGIISSLSSLRHLNLTGYLFSPLSFLSLSLLLFLFLTHIVFLLWQVSEYYGRRSCQTSLPTTPDVDPGTL